MAAADYRLMTDETGKRIAVALEAFQAVPYVATIPTGQWSGSGSDWYITVQASNVTANSLLIPHYDSASEALLNGPIWCVPAASSFTIHTSAIPAGTVTVMVQLLGTLGDAQYQVLSDVYSKSQTDALVAQSTAMLTWLDGQNLSNKDFNALKTAARYRVGNLAQFSNGPSSIGYSGTIEVDVAFNYIRQIVYCDSGAAYRFSYDSGSTWNNWIKLT